MTGQLDGVADGGRLLVLLATDGVGDAESGPYASQQHGHAGCEDCVRHERLQGVKQEEDQACHEAPCSEHDDDQAANALTPSQLLELDLLASKYILAVPERELVDPPTEHRAAVAIDVPADLAGRRPGELSEALDHDLDDGQRRPDEHHTAVVAEVLAVAGVVLDPPMPLPELVRAAVPRAGLDDHGVGEPATR